MIRADGKRNWFVQDGNGQQSSITPKQITFVLGHPDTDIELSGVSLSALYAEAHTKAGSSADLLELAWQLESETEEDEEEEDGGDDDNDEIDYMSQMIMDDVDPLCKLATHVLLCGEENIYFKPRLISGVYHYEARSPANVAELRTLRLSARMEEEARQRRKTLFAEAVLQRRDATLFQEAIESVNESSKSSSSSGGSSNNKIDYATFISHLIDIAVEYDPLSSSSSSSSSASASASAGEHRYQTLSGNTAFSQLRPAYKAVMREVFDSCGLTLCPRSALHVAVQLRVLSKHENLALRRCDFEAKWTRDNTIIQSHVDAMLGSSAAATTAESAAIFNNNGTAGSAHLPVDRDKDLRIDLTGMLAIAIDSADTSEVDDAFSYDVDTDTIYVHIADPSRYFPNAVAAVVSDDEEDRNGGSSASSPDPIVQLAMDRTATLYLPYTKFTMFPPEIATRVLSLNGDLSDGSALTFKFQLDSGGALVSDTMEVMMSRISRPIRLTYEEADIIFTAPSIDTSLSSSSSSEMHDTMRRIHEHMGLRRYWREMEGGAIIINSPIARVSVIDETSDSPQVSCDAIATDTPAWLAVSELMITACCIGAQVCVDNKLPVPFRSQEAFDYAPDEELARYEDGPVRATLTFRQASATLVGVHPGEHASLGLDYYVQVTSPIRRSLDYVTQVQIKQWLSIQQQQNKINDENGSQRLIDQAIVVDEITKAQLVGKQLRNLEATTNRYWQLHFLHELKAMPYVLGATFLKSLKESGGGGGGLTNALLYVDELGFSVVVQTRAELKLGDKVDMEIRGVDARANHIDAMVRKKVTVAARGDAATTSMNSVSDHGSSSISSSSTSESSWGNEEGGGKEGNGIGERKDEELEQLFRDSLSQMSAEGD